MKPTAWVVSLLLLGLLAARADAEPISVDLYRDELVQLREAMARHDREEVRQRAQALLQAPIQYGDDQIGPDRSLLAPLAACGDAPLDDPIRERLDQILAALPSDGAADPTWATADPERLARLTRGQREEAAEEGGRLSGLPLEETHLIAWAGQKIGAFFGGLGDRLSDFFGWLFDLWPDSPSAGDWTGAGPDPASMTTLLLWATAVVVALLAVYFWRVRRRPAKEAPLAPPPSVSIEDADPLSRSSTQWEDYAAQLAAAGRFREAIRAWYHAILVTLYRTGLLHYRKGRTNWEYVYSLPPALACRPDLIDVTRRFEAEWYGRRSCTAERFGRYATDSRKIVSAIHSGAPGR